MTESISEYIDLARAAGFTAIADKTQQILDRKARLAYAYEHYRYVSKEKIAAFNEALKKKTYRTTGTVGRDLDEYYDQLVFIAAQKYSEMPPAKALADVKAAVGPTGEKLFDTMEVAKIDSVRVYRDPIVFGRITGCDDRFFITQWDEDVKIEQLLGPNEG